MLVLFILVPNRLSRDVRQLCHMVFLMIVVLLCTFNLSMEWMMEHLVLTAVFVGGVLYLPLAFQQWSVTRKKKKEWNRLVSTYDFEHRKKYSFSEPVVDIIKGDLNGFALSVHLFDRSWDDESGDLESTTITLEGPFLEERDLVRMSSWTELVQDANRIFSVEESSKSMKNAQQSNYIRVQQSKITISLQEDLPDADKVSVIIDDLQNLSVELNGLEQSIQEENVGKRQDKANRTRLHGKWIEHIVDHASSKDKESILQLLTDVYPTEHPLTIAAVKSKILETSADQISASHAEMAIWLFELAEENLRLVASSASGQGDGRQMMADVQRVIDKRLVLLAR